MCHVLTCTDLCKSEKNNDHLESQEVPCLLPASVITTRAKTDKEPTTIKQWCLQNHPKLSLNIPLKMNRALIIMAEAKYSSCVQWLSVILI